MADIYFHIGMPKSGSSAVRTALMLNEPALSRQGYVVGIAKGDLTSHYLLNAGAFSEHSRNVLSRHYFKPGQAVDYDIIDDFSNRLSQVNRAVLTSEIAFWAQSPKDIFAFEISKHRVHPVLIARNQMEIINNAIGEMLFDHDLQYEEALERALKAELDYADIFYRWTEAFDTFRFVRYDENILPSFADAIGSPDHFQTEIFENVSMPGSVSQFLYRQKPYVEAKEEWEFIIRYFRQHPSTARFPKNPLLPPDLAVDLYQKYQEQNRRISGNLFDASGLDKLRILLSNDQVAHSERLADMLAKARAIYRRNQGQ